MSFGTGYEAAANFFVDHGKKANITPYEKLEQRHLHRDTLDLINNESISPSKYNGKGMSYEKQKLMLRQKVMEKEKEEIEQIISNLQQKKVSGNSGVD